MKEKINWEEKRRKKITPEEVEDMLQLAAKIFEGLSEEEIKEIEDIALDRKYFFRNRNL